MKLERKKSRLMKIFRFKLKFRKLFLMKLFVLLIILLFLDYFYVQIHIWASNLRLLFPRRKYFENIFQFFDTKNIYKQFPPPFKIPPSKSTSICSTLSLRLLNQHFLSQNFNREDNKKLIDKKMEGTSGKAILNSGVGRCFQLNYFFFTDCN